MTVRRVSLKVTPDAALRVPSARDAAFQPLAREPLVFVGGEREPSVLAPPVVPSAASMFGPRGACLVSKTGPLWVCDTGHHRLLGWRNMPTNDLAPADWIIGQKDFASEGRNSKAEGPSSSSLNVPTGLCAINDGLAVADAWNHRVLIWHQRPESSHVPADVVLGQSDFTSGLANLGLAEPTAATMHWPYGVYFHDGRLFVADTGNRRVLVWNSIPTINGQKADVVLGQKDFITRDENAGHEPSNMSMRWPHAIVFWQNYICVSDAGNNRVLLWKNGDLPCGASADVVIGQLDGNNVDFNQSLYWPRSTTLNMPYGLTAKGDWLIVADTANSRLLAWHIDDLSIKGGASRLFGQPDFHEKGDNRWQPATSDSICWPYGVQSVDDLLVIADSGNNRVSIWKLAM